MHIPDGFLSAPVAVSTGAAAALGVGAALRRVRPEAEPGLAPRMGVTAAYVFAAQMVNFPVAGGTSGHLLGATLASVLLGPHAATVVMAAVFLIQALFFLDGGHTALGANVLNMGLAGPYGGYAVYRALAGAAPGPRRAPAASFGGAWAAVMLGALLTALQLALSGTAAGRIVLPAMLGIHALIGIAEGALTAAALALLWKVRPDLVAGRGQGARGSWGAAAGAGLVALALLAPLASARPDGLEWVAERLGFAERAASPKLPGPFPEYTLPGLAGAGWAPALVSLLGSLLMIGTLGLLARAAGRAVPGARRAGLDARLRLACLATLVLTAALLPARDAGKLLLLLALTAAGVLAARVPGRWLAGRALLLLPLVGLAALSVPSLRSGEAALSFYGLVFLRAGISLLATALFVAVTPEPDALAALAAFRIPRPLAETLSFALRYLRLLGDAAARMLRARAARSAAGSTLALRAGAAGGIVGTLFVRSLERSERVAVAMAARGYTGAMPRAALRPLGAFDRAFAAGFALFIAGIWLWR
jgi:cobalt/nickel transport system permease protein